jgi:hypothetical protein
MLKCVEICRRDSPFNLIKNQISEKEKKITMLNFSLKLNTVKRPPVKNNYLSTTANLSPVQLTTLPLIKTPSVQQPVFWGPKGSHCSQV